MRTKPAVWIVGVTVATAIAGRARAAPELAPAGPAPPVGVQAPRVKEGFMVIPAIGINSFQGSTGESSGVGLRVGLLAGNRFAERWSFNLGVAFDDVNVKAPDASDYVLDLGVSPLVHFPQEKFEILAGPVLGSFVDKFRAGSGMFATDVWTFGWTVGVNAGVVVPVGAKVRVGGLLNFLLRNPLKACVSTAGSDVCGSDNLPSEKVLALTAAAMF